MTTHDREVQRLVERGRDREAAELAGEHLIRPDRQGGSMGPLEQLDRLGPALGGVVSEISSNQLDEPTPCAPLTVRGVLEHMSDGATSVAAAFRGEAPSHAGTSPLDSNGSSDPVARFGQAMTGLAEAMHAPGALDRTVQAPFGAVPGETFARFVVLDGLVHGWDLATATHQPYQPPGALVAAVDGFAREAITPAMRELELFAPPTSAPLDANALESLVAFTGRRITRSPR
jgi:uncharacterized protein (TIGR03086 family)